MLKIKETIRIEKRRRQARQIISIGLAVLGVAAVLGIIIFSLPPKGNTPQATPTHAVAQSKEAAPTIAVMQFSAPPPMQIDVKKQYFATVKMAKGGEFVIQLFPDKAPITVNSFVFLAQKGFFNGTTFHRVLEGFMAQGGDPTGLGTGGPGYSFVNEQNDLLFDKPGVVAMANAGPDTNGSQFFIMFGAYGLSENDYTIFGQVISGMDVVNSLTLRDPQQNPNFTGDAIETITITEK
jgi:cyclophilin family peptidyl-prolyl cis-trans isomerase